MTLIKGIIHYFLFKDLSRYESSGKIPFLQTKALGDPTKYLSDRCNYVEY